MSTLSAYILKQTMRPLVGAVIIALLLFLVERLLRLMDLVLNSKGSLNVLLKMLAFLVPHYLGLALPAAFFLGLLLTFSRLQRDSELDAFRASGIGLHQMLRPTLGLALVLAVLTGLVFSTLQPHARYTYRALVHTLAKGPMNKYLQDGIFIEIEGTTYMAEQIDSDHRRFRRVFAFQEKGDGRSAAVTAEDGELLPRPDSTKSTLVLHDGVRLTVNGTEMVNSAQGDLPPAAESASFESYRLPVQLEQDQVFRARGEDERELTLGELWTHFNDPPAGATREDLIATFNDRVIRILSVLFLPLLAIPLAIGGRRANKSFGLVFGIVVLVIYNKALSGGENLVSAGRVSTLWGQWLPFALYALGSIFLFYRAAFTITGNSLLDGLWLRVNDFGLRLKSIFVKPESEQSS